MDGSHRCPLLLTIGLQRRRTASMCGFLLLDVNFWIKLGPLHVHLLSAGLVLASSLELLLGNGYGILRRPGRLSGATRRCSWLERIDVVQ